MLRRRIELRVSCSEKRVGKFPRLDIGAVVDKFADGNPGRQFRHAAEMIAVPMRRDQMIHLPQPGVPDRVHDASRIAGGRGAGVAGVDEQRLMRRPDEQRGIAALHIDDINVQRCRKNRAA